MRSNNRFSWLAIATLLIARTACAEVQIEDARAVLSADARHIEIYFRLHNDTGHELELMKAVTPLAQSVSIKQRSYGATNEPRVWPVAKLEVPTGARVTFAHAARFFLLEGLATGARAGAVLPLVLTFEDEPPLTLELTIEPARQR